MKYEIQQRKTSYQHEYACVNLFKHLIYYVCIENAENADYVITIEVRDYNYNHVKPDLFRFLRGRKRFSVFTPLFNLNVGQINKIRKWLPNELAWVSFHQVIPWAYAKNKRLKSSKYRMLVPNYARAERYYEDSVLKDLDDDFSDYVIVENRQ